MENLSTPPFSSAIPLTTQAPVDQAPAIFYGSDEHITAIIVLLTVVIALGFIGNLAVFGAISQRQKHDMTSTNYLLMNIAVADLLVAVVIAPLRFVDMFHGWPLGKFLCQFLAPIQDAINCVSVVSHTVIALERYRAIVQPFKQRLTIRGSKQAIAIIWVVCYIATGVPMALVLRIELVENKYLCTAEWPASIVRQLFELYLVTIFIIIPLVAQTYAYSCIVKKVNHEIFSSTGSTDYDSRLTKAAQKKARVVKMLVLLVGAFYACSIPRMFTMLLWEFGTDALRYDLGFQYAMTITLIIYYLKHVINPFIIFATSAEFRGSCCLMCQRDFK